MKIAGITLHRYSIPFTRPLRTSQRIFAERTGLILQAVTDSGLTGVGEIAPLQGFSSESLSDCTDAAIALAPQLLGLTVVATPLELAQQMNDFKITYASTAFGIELALADLAAQIAGVPLSRWYREDALPEVPVNALVSGNNAVNQAADKLKAGYRTFKFKIGAQSLTEELQQIESIRSAIGDGASLRLDANRAFDLGAAKSLLSSLEKFNVEYVEEPLNAVSLKALLELRSSTGVPIAIDETLLEFANLTANVREVADQLRDVHDVAILKPAILGSISRTFQLADALQRIGKKIVITSSLDSGIGIAAALHIACALRLESACGLDTGSALKSQLVDLPLIPERGKLAIPTLPGLGVRISGNSVTQQMLTKLYAD